MNQFRRVVAAAAIAVAATLFGDPAAEALPRTDTNPVVITWRLRNGVWNGTGSNGMNYAIADGNPLDHYEVGICSATGTTCWTAD